MEEKHKWTLASLAIFGLIFAWLHFGGADGLDLESTWQTENHPAIESTLSGAGIDFRFYRYKKNQAAGVVQEYIVLTSTDKSTWQAWQVQTDTRLVAGPFPADSY